MLSIVSDNLGSFLFAVAVFVAGSVIYEWLRRKLFDREATLRATIRSTPFSLPHSMQSAIDSYVDAATRSGDLALGRDEHAERFVKWQKWSLPKSVLDVDISFGGAGVTKNVVLQVPGAVYADVVEAEASFRQIPVENEKIRIGDLSHGETLALRVWCNTLPQDGVLINKEKLLIISSDNLRGSVKARVTMPLRDAKIYFAVRACIYAIFWLVWLIASIAACVWAFSKISW